MPISDEVLLQMMFKQHEGQPIEFIMAEYGKAKKLYLKIEQVIAQGADNSTSEEEQCQKPKELPPAKINKEVEPRHYSRGELVCDPREAIKENEIICCICGEPHNVLNARHLKRHDSNPDAYREDCGYPKNQVLMSRKAARAYIERGKNMGKAKADKLAATLEQEATSGVESSRM